jgi:uncharacterized protein (DUF3084 family)
VSPAAAVSSAARTMLPGRLGPARSRLRVVPGRPIRPRRAPFVVLVLLFLAAGLVGLLVLNTSLQQGTFELTDLEQQTALLRDRHSELIGDVAIRSEPGALAARARQLGMVQGTDPRFLQLDRTGSG